MHHTDEAYFLVVFREQFVGCAQYTSSNLFQIVVAKEIAFGGFGFFEHHHIANVRQELASLFTHLKISLRGKRIFLFGIELVKVAAVSRGSCCEVVIQVVRFTQVEPNAHVVAVLFERVIEVFEGRFFRDTGIQRSCTKAEVVARIVGLQAQELAIQRIGFSKLACFKKLSSTHIEFVASLTVFLSQQRHDGQKAKQT